jgi:hypothetical protein
VWLQAVGAAAVEPAATLTFSTYDAAVAAAIAGQGVVLGRQPLINRLLEQGALVAPFQRAIEPARGYFVIVEPSARRKPAVQALAQWLQQQAQPEANQAAPLPPGSLQPRTGRRHDCVGALRQTRAAAARQSTAWQVINRPRGTARRSRRRSPGCRTDRTPAAAR